MICPPQPPDPIVVNWIERHRHPGSFVLHMFGIPFTILGVVYIPIWAWLMSFPVFFTALLLFTGGYLIQFVGHALDGTEPGEWTFLKRFLPRPTRTTPAAQTPQEVA